ncbi:MAG TPA: FHA domain-containing protein, partial [Ktedonobacterales bacterium]
TAGQFFGEVGLLAGTPRNASVRASTNCDLLALDRETFLAVMGNSLPTAQQYAEIARQRGGPPAPAFAAASGISPTQVSAAPGSQPMVQPSSPTPVVGPVPAFGPQGQPAMQPFSAPQPAASYQEHQTGPTGIAPAAGKRTTLPPAPVSQPPFERPTDPVSKSFALRRGKPPEPFERPTDAASAVFVQRLSQALGVLAGPADTFNQSETPQFRPASTGWAYGIVFSSGEQVGRGIMLNTDRLQIGRDLSNEIRLASDALVSRRHAELLRAPNGDYQIHDLGSSNGIFVNNERLAKGEARPLREDDEVRIGGSTFALRKVGARVV